MSKTEITQGLERRKDVAWEAAHLTQAEINRREVKRGRPLVNRDRIAEQLGDTHIEAAKKIIEADQGALTDSLTGFTKWPQWPELLKLMLFYIYPRLGCPFQPLYPHMKPLTHPQQIITNISSTMIRQRLEKKLTVNHLVPPPIAAYLKQNSLF